ncbi:hypothetical protein NEUTE2DRAFT_50347, partial [Neurospora tetrasperma FGSC 2509]
GNGNFKALHLSRGLDNSHLDSEPVSTLERRWRWSKKVTGRVSVGGCSQWVIVQ